ncbi:MAG TPA: metal-dependent hydrolase [Candidatus Paceibacterota bacterium]|jgi:hypothetical protein
MPLDIGVGILLAIGGAELFGADLTPWLVLAGIAAALLPDIDVITIPLLGKWHHRTHTHYPIVYVPLAVLAYLYLDPLYATIFTVGVFAHLVHDTFGIGWGIAWLWPYSGRKFLFFPEKGRREQLGIVATWMPEDEPPLQAAHHDVHWVRYYYFRPNTLAYIEYGTLLVALAVLVTYIW